MKKRSKQNNPEQKTRNGFNSNDMEVGKDFDPIKESKKRYEESGGQPIKSKPSKENEGKL
ncbi:glycogen biosynthesis protein GlgD [Priestia endophytica]|uniref:glycogen biosynthesis protein GlgD n=1 Tax=Priestia endophytica TaxID=135735 RepID=UPI000DCA8878|nr:glycogen biosynthesis protein GlgD [Priestia endophytica]RAS89089.1 glycogen biosynthesis protein GlgD [Priestia endophytica]